MGGISGLTYRYKYRTKTDQPTTFEVVDYKFKIRHTTTPSRLLLST